MRLREAEARGAPVLSFERVSSDAVTRSAPLLVANDLRVDVDGLPVCDGIALRTTGERVLILGAPRALFDAVTGLVRVVRGSLDVRGVAAAEATARGVVAGAPMDPPLPPRWTVAEYVQWSARLAGVPASAARTNARAAIARLQLDAMARTELAKLVPHAPHARRATVVAAALATGAEVIALEDPLGGLPDELAVAYAKVLGEALGDGRAWIVFAPCMPLTSPLAQRADEALVASALRVEGQGPPAELAASGRRFVARTIGPVDALAPALARRGAGMELAGAYVLFDLGSEMTTGELVALCDEADVAVVELVPALRALT